MCKDYSANPAQRAKVSHVPLWQAIIHDWTKFLPCEWFPYVQRFYGAAPPRDPVVPLAEGLHLRVELRVDEELVDFRARLALAGPIRALGEMGAAAREAVPLLIDLMKDKNAKGGSGIPLEAARALGAMGSDAQEAVPALLEEAKDDAIGYQELKSFRTVVGKSTLHLSVVVPVIRDPMG